MDDDTAEAHLLTGLRVNVEGVVIAVETVEDRRHVGRLVLELDVGGLALRGRVVLGRGALGAAPVALADVEAAGEGAGVDLASAGVYEVILGLDDGAGPTLVVDAEHLAPELELLAFGGGRERLQELDDTLAVDDSSCVEFGHTGNLDGFLGGIEINDLLLVVLKRCEALTMKRECCSSKRRLT